MSLCPLLSSIPAGTYAISAAQLRGIEQLLPTSADAIRTVAFPASRNITVALKHMGRALAFPEWYGNNLDALMDCLCDPDVLAPSTEILLLTGVANIHTPKKTLQALGEVLVDAASERCRNGMPLFILCTDPLPGLPPLPEK